MDRKQWMYEISRLSLEFLRGVDKFLEYAERARILNGENRLCCPCRDCQNLISFDNKLKIKEHLIFRGFKPGYTRWTRHGEDKEENTSVVNVESNLRVDLDPVYSPDHEFEDNEMLSDEIVENTNVENDNVNIVECNEVDEMMNEVNDDFIDIPQISESFKEQEKIELYPGCTKFSKISAVFKLYNLKAQNGWSDVSFTALLQLLKDMLPEPNVLPDSCYRAKKLLCPLSLEVERIHACPNDCILYRKENSNKNKCPICNASRYKLGKDDVLLESEPKTKGVPAKILFYLPVIPRFRRLFASPTDAKLLRWHAEERKSDGMLRHPADSPDWRKIDLIFEDFASEPRNLRLGLCTDGMNPYGNMSSRFSTWPVLLCIYNLPPWKCMKRRYMMMPLLISGPKQPGNDIDVYLAPLIEELNKLWIEGVQIFDAYSNNRFTLRAMVFCTVNDFPAYGNLSGYKNKGAKACPICGEKTHSIRLNHCNKNVYMGHRRFLRKNHPYRRNTEKFDGKEENDKAPMPLSGRQVYNVVKNIQIQFGKTTQNTIPEGIWKKQSLFWTLEYWPHLEVRHCLDGMHIIKNVCESLVGSLLNIPGKTKDSVKARKDMVEMGIRLELAPKQKGKNSTWLPPAKCTLYSDEKKKLLQCLQSIKVPSGYSSNISKKVSIKDNKLIGMKSHDYHVLLTQFLPIAIRGIGEEPVRVAITNLCFFFNTICSKVIDPDTLDQLQNDVVLTLCDLESFFPPSFFDIMVHLIVHLVREIKMCGPMFLRYMYPFERAMGQLKGLVRSRSKPEGSIVEGYIAEEVVEFYNDYKGEKQIGIPISRHEGRLEGKGTIGSRRVSPSYVLRGMAHLKVLQHMAVVAPYVNMHLEELRSNNPGKQETLIEREHELTFSHWFKTKIESDPNVSSIDPIVYSLSLGPSKDVQTWQGYDMNGFTWYTKDQDGKSTVQNSGVTVTALYNGESIPYYGQIKEIWELDYMGLTGITVFMCDWIDSSAVQVDKYGFTTVDLSRHGFQNDPFILADKQAMQVFYIADPSNERQHVVIPGKRRIVGIGNVVDEDEYNNFEEISPFSVGIGQVINDTKNSQTHLRSDCKEEVLVQKRKKKQAKKAK